ncbi:hypothetical protein [Paenibacillus sedimenti]|uniref:Uncharacterized protein n=1 Tax=Paenibacillus sedimenti TaxID=2770274 RepID=A0A926KQT9_9BACL|nr:hypothetical protein [Paenibacillus sedimenti]MBD0381231.1 hypothetical protein [Paenibacillus sedimenti]
MSKITAANYDSIVAWLKDKIAKVNNPAIDPDSKTKLQKNIDITRKELQLYLAAEVAKDDEAWRSKRISKAVEMDHPLITPEKKAELMIEYDLIDGAILAYQRSEYVKKYPSVKDAYEKLGWIVAEPKEEASTEERSASVGPSTPSGERQFEIGGKEAGKSNDEATQDDYASAAAWL